MNLSPDSNIVGQGQAVDSSKWQCMFCLFPSVALRFVIIFLRYVYFPDIAEFFRNWNQPVNFDDRNWFDQFQEPLMKFKSEFRASQIRGPTRNVDDEVHNSEKSNAPRLKSATPPLSPLSVEFFRVSFSLYLIYNVSLTEGFLS